MYTRKGANSYKTFGGPKRRRKQNCRKKEEQIIKTRLIEISMKMEDHIYHKAPISESQAELFIREVSSYKTQCSTDERSLQVIEKLTRCMKALIAEYQEQRLVCRMTTEEQTCLNDVRVSATSSPVYSLPDEDKTQLTQEPILHNIEDLNYLDLNPSNRNDNNKQFHSTQVTNIELLKTVDHVQEFNKDEDIIDLCDEDEEVDTIIKAKTDTVNGVITGVIDGDVNIQNVTNIVSNLSIREQVEERTDSDTECSQSILNNFTMNIAPHKDFIVRPADSAISNNSKTFKMREVREKERRTPTISTNTALTIKPVFTSGSNTHHFNHPLVAKVSEAINKSFNLGQLNTSNKENGHLKAANTTNSTVQQIHTSVLSNNNVNITKIKEMTRVSCKSIDLSPKRDPILKNKHIQETNNVVRDNISKSDQKMKNNGNQEVNSTVAVKKKRRPRKQKIDEPKSKVNSKLTIDHQATQHLKDKNDNATQTVKKKYSRKKMRAENNGKDFSIPIYSKNVENDLSWLENIRYVREIAEDEYDRKLTDLNEDFWNNCTLPPNFDESDFL